ncbi:hypothetical protein Y032_0393g598 [Ancylostoma ceylanicum]|uniref:Uncharacterized protein n=1 Tax=Ancylostoma ceylanicum TaxID=53326 RepID=A0A016RRY8_9BILA|nr:hypothetical protein Y032_0393g598 [Ancylostoma ceylanicum]
MPPKPSAKGAKKSGRAPKTPKASRSGERKKRCHRKESHSGCIRCAVELVRRYDVKYDVEHGFVRYRRPRAHRCCGVATCAQQQAVEISSREVQTSAHLILSGELAKLAVSEGTKTVTKYTSSE